MPDFTLTRYQSLLDALRDGGYRFQTFRDYLEQPASPCIILRHDVDRLPENSLGFARIQHERGIVGTYYFRVVPGSFDPGIIREVAGLGHEIGYHYEDLDLARRLLRRKKTPEPATHLSAEVRRMKADNPQPLLPLAMELFQKHLSVLRGLAPVTTVCMHGSPLSPYDNKDLWKKYNYRDFGIEGEPYFDVDFSRVLYLTDTGRRWDGDRVSLRDVGRNPTAGKGDQPLAAKYRFHSTGEIIRKAREGNLPEQILFTFHPQRWTNRPAPWLKELLWQGVKNGVKRAMVRGNKSATSIISH